MRIILYYISGLSYIQNGTLEKINFPERNSVNCTPCGEIRIEYDRPPILYDDDVTRQGTVQGVFFVYMTMRQP